MRPLSRLSPTSGLVGTAGASTVLGTAGRLSAQPRLAPRTTKVSEKLVLLPETIEQAEDLDDELVQRLAKQKRHRGGFDIDSNVAPLLTEEEVLRRGRIPPDAAKSYAERLPKAHRAEKLARVTAYCTAQAYRMGATASFVKEWHGARTKMYDDCLYTAYQLPLLPGRGGYRVRSSPILKSPGGRVELDEEIERSEQRDYHEEYFGEADEHSVGGSPSSENATERRDNHDQGRSDSPTSDRKPDESQEAERDGHEGQEGPNDSQGQWIKPRTRMVRRLSPSVFSIGELFVFSYGVVVFWNFTERQEKDVLADLTFSSLGTTGPPLSLATQPLSGEDFETEEFHFEYSTEISRPRVFNDMITLRSGDHMIKLGISHGISQSTKLCFFEEAMAKQMVEAKDIPRRLAVTGKLGLKREEVFQILGRLFKSRVEVNLSSNVLDVPNFFWESEPTLYPLYIAVREYLEIKPRIQVLNERCRVFLDLTEILSDSIADNTMSHQTWIIIVLILISIIITISEVILRFGLLSARAHMSPPSFLASLLSNTLGGLGVSSSAGTPGSSCICPTALPDPTSS
ncbi:hypothetical protein Egran_00118, partial [Elaphomyces granulatus]